MHGPFKSAIMTRNPPKTFVLQEVQNDTLEVGGQIVMVGIVYLDSCCLGPSALKKKQVHNTVDGRNPAPPAIYETL